MYYNIFKMNKSQGYFLNALKSALDFLFTDFSAMFPKKHIIVIVYQATGQAYHILKSWS